MKTLYHYLLFFLLLTISTYSSAQVFINTISDSTAVLNEDYAVQVSAFGEGTLSYSLLQKPTGMAISASGLITWKPTQITQGGLVTVKVTDSHVPTPNSYTRNYYVYVSDAVSCPTSLKAYWKLNESSGPYKDTINSNNATLTTPGAVASVAGKVGKGQQFTADDDLKDISMLNVSDNSLFDISRAGKFSISLWFKKDAAGVGLESFIGRITDNGWYWIGLNDNKVLFQMEDGSGLYPTVQQSSSLALGQWHHVVAIYDGVAKASGSCTMKLYVDNVALAPLAFDFADAAFDGSQNLTIGWLNYVPTKLLSLNGALDDIAFYDKALSPTEIATLYTDGQSGIAQCKPGNYAPQVRSEPSLTAKQGQLYSYTLNTVDVDGDAVTVTAPTLPGWLKVVDQAGKKVVTGTPRNIDYGNFNVSLNITDGKLASPIVKSFTIFADSTNDIPKITTAPAALTVDEDVLYSYNVAYQDSDLLIPSGPAEIVTVSLVNKPSWLNVSGTLISGTPGNNNAGHTKSDTTYQIQVKVTDKAGASNIQSFNLLVKNINDAPVVNSQSALSVVEDNSLAITLANMNVTDVDDVYPTDFTLAVQAGANYTKVGNTITPTLNFNGSLVVPVKLTDGGGTTVDYNLNVTVTAFNDSPDITSTVSTTTIKEGVAFLYNIIVSDPDNTPVVTAVKKPTWLSLLLNNGIYSMSGTPGFSNVGKDTIILRASDGNSFDEQIIYLTIEKVNRKPVFQSSAPVSVDEDALYSYIPSATDDDGDVLIYSATTLPTWLTFNPSTRELKGTPTNDVLGLLATKDFNVVLRVSDSKENVDQSFTITVFNVNDIPVISSQKDTSSFVANENYPITLDKINVSDPDNAAADLSIEILPGADYEFVGNIINVTTFRGRLLVNIKVKDLASSSTTFKYVVDVKAGTGIGNLKSTNSLISKVYPVPANNQVYFSISVKEKLKFYLTNSDGRLVKNATIDSGSETFEVNVSDLSQGTYYYNVVSEKSFQTGKIVVVK